jgi:RNA polymerase sigma-70 factor, ECF subfamily
VAVIAEIALRGNPETRFEELYAACQPRVYRTCLAILRNADDAAEATQEVFSRVLPLLTELREPHVWLQTVARNYCLDQLRRQKVRGNGPPLDEDTPGSRRDDPERETLLRDALRQAFEALSPRERRALGRVLLMDDSLSDIAGMLGVSYGAAAQVVSRARRRAALAARAVIGASLAGLARLTLPRGRDRAGRMALQALESGQNIVLAAAVVFTAGSMAQPVVVSVSGAVAGAHTSAPAMLPATAGAHSLVPSAGAAPPSAAALPVSPLPPGYHAVQVAVTVQTNPPPSGGHGPIGSPSGGGSATLTLVPTYSSGCAGVTAGAAPSGLPAVAPQTVQACAP